MFTLEARVAVVTDHMPYQTENTDFDPLGGRFASLGCSHLVKVSSYSGRVVGDASLPKRKLKYKQVK